MITIYDLAEHRLQRTPTFQADFAEAKLSMIGGCARCHATIAAYNAYPSKTGYWMCGDCIDDNGYETIRECEEDNK